MPVNFSRPKGVKSKGMAKQEDLHKTALAALRSEKRIGPHFKPEALTIDADGVATIESEVPTIAIKRLALERLAGVPGIGGIVDRLRVKPASPMSDDGILDHLRKAYYQEALPSSNSPSCNARRLDGRSCVPDCLARGARSILRWSRASSP